MDRHKTRQLPWYRVERWFNPGHLGTCLDKLANPPLELGYDLRERFSLRGRLDLQSCKISHPGLHTRFTGGDVHHARKHGNIRGNDLRS